MHTFTCPDPDNGLPMTVVLNEWISGMGIEHPTGGYDELSRRLVSGPEMSKDAYLRRGRLHRLDGPAVVLRTKSGRKVQESYFIDGHESRLDGGPTQVGYDREEGIEHERWREGRVLHREGGPASIDYRIDGSIRHEAWNAHDLLHRTDGPAVTDYDSGGNPYREVFYLRGRKVTPEEFASFREAIEGGAPEEWALAYIDGRTA